MIFNSLVFAADHAGFLLKEALLHTVKQKKWLWEDLGVFEAAPIDYPDLIPPLVMALRREGTCGVLICGSGIGASIAANRYTGLRAALCHEGLSAQLARQHNDANVLVLGGRLIGLEMAIHCLTQFIATPFEGGRHTRRVQKIDEGRKS